MLSKIFALLDKDQKKKIFYYQIIFLFQGILEALGLVSVIPLIYAVSSSDKDVLLEKLFFLKKFLLKFELQEIQILFISIFLVYILFLNFIIVINFIITEKLSRNFYKSLFVKLLEKFFVFNPNSFSKFDVSDKINTLSYDLQHSTIYIFKVIFKNFSKLYTLFFIFLVMIVFDPIKTIFFFSFFLLIYLLIFRSLGKNLKVMGKNTSMKNTEIIKNIKETFNNLKVIHIDKLFDLVAPKLKNDGDIWVKSMEDLQINTFLLKIFAELLAIITIVILMFYMLVNNQQEMIIASIGFYVYAFYRSFPSMQSIFGAFVSVKGWSKVLDSVCDKIENSPKKLNFGTDEINFNQKIIIENLSYQYDKDSQPIFENLNIEIKKGSIIGIKGESGSGKTTFLDILAGIKTPLNGFVKVDSKTLNLNNVLNWFTKISYVPQKIFLFNDTIKKNIIVNNKNISEDEMLKILKITDLEILTENNNNLNLETKVSELNNNLSGGEIQRLSIAKALLKYPQLLIFDETTSGIQIEKEKKIINNIKESFPDITIIFISHRDNSLKICDKVINF